MSLKDKFFPENRLGLNRFWDFSRGGIDNFRTGLRDAVSGVEQTRSRMMDYDQLLVWAVLSNANWLSDGVFSLYYSGRWPQVC